MTAPDIPALLALNAHIWATADRPPNEDTTWADVWAEQRKDERGMTFDPRADDRAADDYAEKRWGA